MPFVPIDQLINQMNGHGSCGTLNQSGYSKKELAKQGLVKRRGKIVEAPKKSKAKKDKPFKN